MIEVYHHKKLVGSYATIQDAVDAAGEGDTIKLGAGVFNETVTVDKAVNFEGAGDGQTIMDGTGLSGSGLHLVGDLGDKNKISISGISFENYSVAGVQFDDDATLKELEITDSHFADNRYNGVRIGGDYDPVALDKVTIRDSSFENNGDGSSNGDGDILFFQYYGDAKIENVDITGGGTADNGIQFRGDAGDIGNVDLKNVNIDGAYAKTGIAVYNYADGDGLDFKNTTVTATAGWGKPVVIDDVGGKIDANGLDTSGAPGRTELAGTDADNDIKASDGASILNGKGGDDRLKGGDGDDVLLGGDGDDKADGHKGNDIFDGGAGNDDLKGHQGDDAFFGGAGDDRIDGGKGFDVAVYDGGIDDFDFNIKGHDKIVITDLRGGSPEGTDTVKDVELLIFTNGTADTSDDTYFDVGTQTAFTDEIEYRFQQGFETDTVELFGTVSRVASGTDGIASAEGSHHAILDGGGYTHFGAYEDTWSGTWTTEVDVYLDATDNGGGWAAGEGFEFSSAVTGSDGNHQRDFIFHVTQDTSTGELLINASNNTNFAPQEHLETLAGTAQIDDDGWYTFQSVFHDDGGVLVVDMNVLDADGNIVFTKTLSDPVHDTISEIGGNRYGWFTTNDVAGGIAVDNIELYYQSEQTFTYPTVDDLFA